jgi:hypothetical protein
MSAKVVWCPLLHPLTVRDQLGRLLAFDTEEFVHAADEGTCRRGVGRMRSYRRRISTAVSRTRGAAPTRRRRGGIPDATAPRSGFCPVLVTLADLDRARGLEQQGGELLRKAMSIEPNNANLQHAFPWPTPGSPAQYAGALGLPRRASELASDNARYAYVYAVALNSTRASGQSMAVHGRVASTAFEGPGRVDGAGLDRTRHGGFCHGISARPGTGRS